MVSKEGKHPANCNLHFFIYIFLLYVHGYTSLTVWFFHVGHVADLKEHSTNSQGIESSVLESADAPWSLSSNSLKSRFRKWLSLQGSSSSQKAILQYIEKWIKTVNFKLSYSMWMVNWSTWHKHGTKENCDSPTEFSPWPRKKHVGALSTEPQKLTEGNVI